MNVVTIGRHRRTTVGTCVSDANCLHSRLGFRLLSSLCRRHFTTCETLVLFSRAFNASRLSHHTHHFTVKKVGRRQVNGGDCIIFSSGSSACSAAISGRVYITLLEGCTRGDSDTCLPTFCAAVTAACNNSCRGFMSTLCSGSRLVHDKRGLFSNGQLRDSLNIICNGSLTRIVLHLFTSCDTYRRRVDRRRHCLYSTGVHVRRSLPRCSSTGFALHVSCNRIRDCSHCNAPSNCCASTTSLITGVRRTSDGSRCFTRPIVRRLFSGRSCNGCNSTAANALGLYFLAAGSVANNGSNSPIFSDGGHLVKLTFSNG